MNGILSDRDVFSSEIAQKCLIGNMGIRSSVYDDFRHILFGYGGIQNKRIKQISAIKNTRIYGKINLCPKNNLKKIMRSEEKC